MKRLALVVVLIASAQLAVTQGQTSEPAGMTPSFSPVTWERLLNAADEP